MEPIEIKHHFYPASDVLIVASQFPWCYEDDIYCSFNAIVWNLMGAVEKGPISNRKCRDVFFLLLFTLFWVGMFVIAGFAIKTGDLNRLQYGMDVDGSLCGVVNNATVDMSSMPYVYYFNPIKVKSTYRRCVSACPNATGEVICKYGIDNTTDVATKLASGDCMLTIKSKESI